MRLVVSASFIALSVLHGAKFVLCFVSTYQRYDTACRTSSKAIRQRATCLKAAPTISSTKVDKPMETVNGPFQPLQISPKWGRQPLLIRNAFDPSLLVSTEAWPDWDDVVSWASARDDDDEYQDEDPEAPILSRLIRQENKERLDSFTLELGPFEESYLQELTTTLTEENNHHANAWSLLLNDVDRIHPPLSHWMDQTFDFLPRWRRDDGQISIAKTGGGIGPHVDNYDVFLIQSSGRRKWLLGDFLTSEQEMEFLIQGLDVRILDLEQEDHQQQQATIVEMNPGDMLYLPPRLVHWGTSLSDDCMTLSVGCRAPSASELVSRVAEHLSYSMSTRAANRYSDIHLLSSPNSNDTAVSITTQIKEEMKRLVSEAVDEILDNKLLWDEIVGCLVTEPKRPMESYGAFDDEDDPSSRAHDLATAVLKDGMGALYRTEGISFSTSIVEDTDDIYYRVFAAGQKFEWKRAKDDTTRDSCDETILLCLAQGQPLTKEALGASHASSEALSILTDLQLQGFVYHQAEDVDDDQ